MPRGIPSRASQVSITARAVGSSKIPNPCRTARARSAKSVTASEVTPPSTVSGDTEKTVSAGTSRCSRDVARIRGTGERARTSRIAAAAATSTCSQLSSRMRSWRPATASATVSMTRASPCGVMPRAAAIASGTASGFVTGASSTSQLPSAKSSASSAATARARLVLPTPPTPLRVTSGRERTSPTSSGSTSERPTRAVAAPGRLPRLASRLTGSVSHRRELVHCVRIVPAPSQFGWRVRRTSLACRSRSERARWTTWRCWRKPRTSSTE